MTLRNKVIEGPTKKQNWYIYICQARTGRYYTGIALDPPTRLTKHNDGSGSKFAKDQGPFCLVYVSLPFESKSQARQREILIKGWSRIKKEKLINGKWF